MTPCAATLVLGGQTYSCEVKREDGHSYLVRSLPPDYRAEQVHVVHPQPGVQVVWR